LREFGYVGINYLVVDSLKAEGYMNVEQIRELAKAGWEVGSHSVTHANLLKSNDAAWQISQSRLDLESALALPVTTFAYPFGAMNQTIMKTTAHFYEAAVGLGPQFKQSQANLYYLRRRPVKYEWDIQTFGKFLPWNTPP
jgi:peptidoglycan/xylan/chitin deacetylase (PgdA/CDA1 family)